MKVEIETNNGSASLEFDEAIHVVNKASEPLPYVILTSIQTIVTLFVNFAVIRWDFLKECQLLL